MVLFTLMYRAGRTWARILSAVLAILAALQSLWGLISIPFLAAVDPGIVPDYLHSAVVAARDTAISLLLSTLWACQRSRNRHFPAEERSL